MTWAEARDRIMAILNEADDTPFPILYTGLDKEGQEALRMGMEALEILEDAERWGYL